MKTRKKQKVIIGTLVAVILGMCVGYAVLSQVLTITGTSGISGDFNIQFTSIEEHTMVNSKTVTKGGIGTTTANFTVDLEKPGSSALYDVTVENKGSMDAVLKSIEGLDESNGKEPIGITYTIIDLDEGESLSSGSSKKFQVKVVWNPSSTTVPTTSKTLTLKLNYEQKTGTDVTPTPESSFSIDNNGIITEYSGEDKDVIIPETIGGVPVTTLGDNSFSNKQLTSVVIPDGVTTIGNSSFSYNQLTSVIIPDSVTTIKGSAFSNNQLTEVELPKNITSIESSSFSGNQLTSVVIPDGVTSIGHYAFENNKLTSVVLSKNMTSIGMAAFSGNQLTSVVIPEQVTSISDRAFMVNGSSNPNLTKIVNMTGKPFNWYNITMQGSYNSGAAATGTYGQVIITAE